MVTATPRGIKPLTRPPREFWSSRAIAAMTSIFQLRAPQVCRCNALCKSASDAYPLLCAILNHRRSSRRCFKEAKAAELRASTAAISATLWLERFHERSRGAASVASAVSEEVKAALGQIDVQRRDTARGDCAAYLADESAALKVARSKAWADLNEEVGGAEWGDCGSRSTRQGDQISPHRAAF